METPNQETTPQQTAQEAYEQNHRVLSELLSRIGNRLGEIRISDEPKTWPQVGDQGHAIEVLQNLADFLGA
jgi:hypothetical protein